MDDDITRGRRAVDRGIAWLDARRSQSAPAAVERAETEDAADHGVLHRRVSDIRMEPVRWLWPGRIARGKVSMIAGHPGLGKSQLTASLAAIVTTGGQWPVDRTVAPAGRVVILSAEDDPADTIAPRLAAAGADISRVHVIDAVGEVSEDGRLVRRTPDICRDLDRLDALLGELGDVMLLVVDPITAYLGGIDSHRTSDVRGALAPLSEMAARHGAAVVCVSHLRKAGGAEALMRVTGSLAFVAAARAAYIVARDPENEERRLVLPAKNNLGDDRQGLAYRIESATAGDGIETSRIVWDSEPVNLTADQALEAGGQDDERTERDDAADWLRDLLGDGPTPAKEIQAQAKEAGYSWSTVRRAKAQAGIEVVKAGFAQGWKWQLSEGAQGAHEDAQGEKGEHLRRARASSDASTGYEAEIGAIDAEEAQGAQRAHVGEDEHLQEEVKV